mgnify:CR=1 FL=1
MKKITVNFELMKDKPKLDIPTLNYVWDMLWRFKACNLRKNAKERALFAEYERLMKHIKELAESEA